MGTAVVPKSAKRETEKAKAKSAAPLAPGCEGPQFEINGGAAAGMPLFLGRRVNGGCADERRRGIQTKLEVNQPGDSFERQADKIAESATGPQRTPQSFLKLKAPAQSPNGPSAIPVSDSGSPLSPAVRQRVEPALGTDLSHVRVHSAPADRDMAHRLGAQAFTHGRHIWLGPSQSAADVKLMAHEATHVVQQGAASSKPHAKPPALQRREETAPPAPPSQAHYIVTPDPSLNEMVKDVQPSGRDQAKKGKAPKDKKDSPPDPAEVASKRREVLQTGKPAADKATKHLPQLGQAAHAAKSEAHKPPSAAKSGGKNGAGKPKADAKSGKGKTAAKDKSKGKGKGRIRPISARVAKPSAPSKVSPPKIAAPVDAAGLPLMPDPAGDAAIMGLAASAQAMRLRGYVLKQQAAQESQNAAVISRNMAKAEHGISQAGEGIDKSQEHVSYRRDVVKQAEGALHVSEGKAEMVAAGAPKYQSTSEEGKSKSGPMSSESKSLASENDSKQPDDDDAAEKSREQGEKLGKLGSDIGSMDDAMTQTKSKADSLASEAAKAKQTNTKTQQSISGTTAALDQTQGKIDQMNAQNAAAAAQLAAHASGPAQMAAQAAALDAQGDAAIQSSLAMEQRVHAAQNNYLAGMRSVPKSKRQKPQANASAPVLVQRQADPAAAAPAKKDERVNLNLAAKVSDALPSWLTGEEKQTEEQRAAAQAAEQKRRAAEIAEINAKAGGDFSKLSAADKAAIALELTGSHLFSSVGGINWPNFLGNMIQGLIDPRMALMGAVSGISMIASGVANLFSAEQWSKDPLGNLLKSAAEIATGITIVLGSITALAMAIIAILVVAAILTLGALGPLAAAVIPFCGTVVSTLGPWTIEAAAIAMELHILVMIKDLIDAATADTAEKLQTQSDAVTEDAKNAGQMAMQIGMAAVGEAGGEALSNTKFGQAMASEMRGIGEDFRIVKPSGEGAAAPVPQAPEALPPESAEAAPKAEAPAPHGEAPAAEAGAAEPKPAEAMPAETTPADPGAAEPKPGEAGARANPEEAKAGETKPGENKPGEDAASKPASGKDRVAAERDAPDGHKVKSTKDGGCEVCSPEPCPSLQQTVETQLEGSEIPPETKANLKAEAEAAAATPDAEARAEAGARVLEETKAAAKQGKPAEKPAAEAVKPAESERPAAEGEKPTEREQPAEGEKSSEKPGEPEKPGQPEEQPSEADVADSAEQEDEKPDAKKVRKNAKREIEDRLDELGKERSAQQEKLNEATAKAREAGKKLNEKYENFQKVRSQTPAASPEEIAQARQEWRDAQAELQEAEGPREAEAHSLDKILEQEKAARAALDEGTAREKYMGATPGKASPQGLKVQAEMRKLGLLDTDPATGETIFKASDGEWYPLEDADMAHKVDAVEWWNNEGRFYGAKSPQVRAFMLKWENYILDHFSLNRSAGARLGKTYLPPLK